MTFELPKLPYTYNALEPHIDGKTMEIHYSKHHATYVTNLNKALETAPEWKDTDLLTLLRSLDKLPEDIKNAVRNNGGGHYNHSLFWELLSPAKQDVTPMVTKYIQDAFGSIETFQANFIQTALARFGSGWTWLCISPDKKLQIMSTPNQDSPIMTNLTPILGLDVWEHAYYLNYQNRRSDYIAAWWNVVNWQKVEENLKAVS